MPSQQKQIIKQERDPNFIPGPAVKGRAPTSILGQSPALPAETPGGAIGPVGRYMDDLWIRASRVVNYSYCLKGRFDLQRDYP